MAQNFQKLFPVLIAHPEPFTRAFLDAPTKILTDRTAGVCCGKLRDVMNKLASVVQFFQKKIFLMNFLYRF